MWDITERFPLWGTDGADPGDGSFYDGKEQVPDTEINYLWNSIKLFQDELVGALEDIDSDRDGRVDVADTTALLNDTDIDDDGDGVCNAAENFTETYRGSDLDAEYYSSETTDSLTADGSKYLVLSTLADGETLSLNGVSLSSLDGSTVNAAIEVVSISSGSATVETTVTSTETTNGSGSYTNTTGSPQTVGVRLHNTGTAESTYTAGVTTRT